MKKLLSLLMCLVLSLGMMFAVACGGTGSGDAAFDGKYKEASKEDLTMFATELKEAKTDYEFDIAKGLKMEFKSNTLVPGEGTMDIGMTILSSNKDDKFQLAGNVSMNIQDSDDADEKLDQVVELYYKDGKSYMNTAGVKVAVSLPQEKLDLNNFDQAFESIKSFDIVLTEFEGYGEDVKYSMDKSNDETKIKFEFKGKVDQEIPGAEVKVAMDADCVAVFVFDANKNLVAYKYDAKMSGKTVVEGEEYNFNSTAYLMIAPFAGDVEFPEDLSTYLGA